MIRARTCLTRSLVVLLVGVGFAMLPAAPAFAHCPGGVPQDPYAYAYGTGTIVKSVRVEIGWVASPNTCSGQNVSHSITICHDNCAGYHQVGWQYYQGYSQPRGYCERQPLLATGNAYTITEYNLSAGSQNYSIRRNNPTYFECRIDGSTKQSTVTSYLGFGSGALVPVQAEAHATHSQLGHVAPNWMLFSGAERVPNTGSAFGTMNLTNAASGDPVWNTRQPDQDGFWVNTDADHD